MGTCIEYFSFFRRWHLFLVNLVTKILIIKKDLFFFFFSLSRCVQTKYIRLSNRRSQTCKTIGEIFFLLIMSLKEILVFLLHQIFYFREDKQRNLSHETQIYDRFSFQIKSIYGAITSHCNWRKKFEEKRSDQWKWSIRWNLLKWQIFQTKNSNKTKL